MNSFIIYLESNVWMSLLSLTLLLFIVAYKFPIILNSAIAKFLSKYYFATQNESRRLFNIKLLAFVLSGGYYLFLSSLVYLSVFICIFFIILKNKYIGQAQYSFASYVEGAGYLISAIIGAILSIGIKNPKKKFRHNVWKAIKLIEAYACNNFNLKGISLGKLRNI